MLKFNVLCTTKLPITFHGHWDEWIMTEFSFHPLFLLYCVLINFFLFN